MIEFPPYYYTGGGEPEASPPPEAKDSARPPHGLVFDRRRRQTPAVPYSLRLGTLAGALKTGLAGKGVIKPLG